MDEEEQFLKNLFTFARWVTFATGTCGVFATVMSFADQNTTTGILYLVGTTILYSVSTFFMMKQRQVSKEGGGEQSL